MFRHLWIVGIFLAAVFFTRYMLGGDALLDFYGLWACIGAAGFLWLHRNRSYMAIQPDFWLFLFCFAMGGPLSLPAFYAGYHYQAWRDRRDGL